MSSLKNKVQLIGNIGNAPEIKTFEDGKKLAKFSLATNETYTNKAGEKITDTQWHNVLVWGAQAGTVEKYLKKGQEILVSGKLSYSTYDDKDGIKRYRTDIIMDGMQMFSKAKD